MQEHMHLQDSAAVSLGTESSVHVLIPNYKLTIQGDEPKQIIMLKGCKENELSSFVMCAISHFVGNGIKSDKLEISIERNK